MTSRSLAGQLRGSDFEARKRLFKFAFSLAREGRIFIIGIDTAMPNLMRFFLQINGRTEGPFKVEEIEDLHGAGRVNRSTPCRREGENAEWSSIYNLVPTAIWVTNPQNQPPRTSIDPPDRKGFPKNIFWIGLLGLVVLLLALPFLVMAVEGRVFKESATQLQALVAAPASNQFGQGSNPANLDQVNRQMDGSAGAAVVAGILGFALLLFPIF